VRHAFNLGLDAEPFPLVRRVGERLRTEGVLGADRPVALENDLNASALGAAALLDVGDDLAYLALGTGVAVGLVLEGRLRRRARGGRRVPARAARGCRVPARAARLPRAVRVGPGPRAGGRARRP